MQSIKTIVILDLETTGLPFEENNETRMTEIALIACERQHIMKARNALPRIVHKLNLALNPQRPIVDIVTRKTGVTNELLQDLPPFDGSVIQMLKLFLKRLPGPVCLIAQNGFKFDFPILRRQLSELHGLLGNDLYCADSQEIFRSIIPELGKDYTIGNVYRLLHDGENFKNSHRAEDDCMAVLSCIMKRKERFFNYLDNQYSLKIFNEIEPLRKLQ